MPEPVKTPALMSNRNHVFTLGDAVDEFMWHLRVPADWPWTEVVKKAATNLGRRLLHEAVFAFAKGSESGIQQAANLMENPAYYERKKKNREESLAREGEKRRVEKDKRQAEDFDPSIKRAKQEKELITHLGWAQHNLIRAERELAKFRAESLSAKTELTGIVIPGKRVQ